MRLIHTADWHLGRIFHNVHLTEDQAHVLEQLFDLAKESRADALLVSGDVYDRPIPPADAVKLLDDFLSRVVLDLKLSVILIAGNHDSPDRLGFGSKLLATQRLHIAGSLSADVERVMLGDRHGSVCIYALPYAEPPLVRECLECCDICDHDSAMSALLSRIRAAHPAGVRSILLAHAFVAGGIECESERSLSVGGSGAVHPACFDGFHYVALGHLHRPQSAGPEQTHYSGSLLKYSFSEAGHTKSVNLVEIDMDGRCAVERVPLTPRHDVRCIRGTLQELLQASREGEGHDDYLMATLTDREPLLDPLGKLLPLYPNLLHIERTTLTSFGDMNGPTRDHRGLSDLELFRAFFTQVTGEDLDPDEAQAFSDIVEKLLRDEREAG